jgi:hypothetical protein
MHHHPPWKPRRPRWSHQFLVASSWHHPGGPHCI